MKNKALPVLEHQQGATKGRDLKLRILRYTQNLSLGRERSSELPLLLWKLPEIRLISKP
jgi:hypothetical protein